MFASGWNPIQRIPSQKKLLRKLKIFAYVISRKWIANQQKQLRNNGFQVKASRFAKKLAPSYKKWKSAQKVPFCTKVLAEHSFQVPMPNSP